jgi:hypothetical protein
MCQSGAATNPSPATRNFRRSGMAGP